VREDISGPGALDISGPGALDPARAKWYRDI